MSVKHGLLALLERGPMHGYQPLIAMLGAGLLTRSRLPIERRL